MTATRSSARSLSWRRPYGLDGERRVFFWTGAFESRGPAPGRGSGPVPGPDAWAGTCATTHGLTPVTGEGATEPPLFDSECDELVVDGTVAGDSTVFLARDYDPPSVAVRSVGPASPLSDGGFWPVRDPEAAARSRSRPGGAVPGPRRYSRRV